ncbi:beta-ketoacyl-[acyl-carrier-protein] synthase family protein [Methylotenera versatilis]|uniref:3-oxoacyl-[acyl-carrier-protein] synthase 2 n=1 Tax=Methylotenera versatilis (strain 301) TaxID=666681 RepID=D7DJC4_METV0|nr:Beta-ketoacyl synthase [Methylotenera versatilis 301]
MAHLSNSQRVVITGLSIVSPLGNTIAELTRNVFSGVSGIKRLNMPFVDEMDCKIAAQAQFDPANHFSKHTYSMLDRTSQIALYTSVEAIKDANLIIDDAMKPRMGIYLGTGMGGAQSIEDGYVRLYKEGASRLKPFTVLMSMNNAAASAIALEHQLTGPNQTFSTACSSSAVAIGEASRLIRHGYADVMLAGGTEALLTFGTMKAWEALRTLAEEDVDDIGASCKPFSVDRTGLVLGEGSAMLVLESYEHAVTRGAKIYAEIAGYGAANDCNHITQPSVSGQSATMQAALNDADLSANAIQYINAHGTGTKLNDITETNSIKKVFGSHAYELSVSSTKSMHGHLMGAAGALEAVITTLAVHSNTLPPTINLAHPDLECDLDYVPNHSKTLTKLEYAMSNSFAFGGTGAALILKKLN